MQIFSYNFSSKNILYIALLIVTTFVVYLPTDNAKFTNWDDDGYVTQNKDISTFDIHHLLTKSYECNYHPLTMVSLAIDYSIGQLKPSVYHRTNLILHLANCLLIFYFLLLLFKNSEIAFIAAIGFGIHPMNVESVAWVSERKNVLYTFFFFASLIGYLKYLENRKTGFYLISFFLFLFSLLSKGMAVSLSVTLLAIDFYQKRDLLNKKVILEKIPFFIASLVFGYIAIINQPIQSTAIDVNRQSHVSFLFFEKILIATQNVGHYVLKLIFPSDLAAFYPYPDSLTWPFYIVSFIVLAVIVVIGILLIKYKNYYSSIILFAILLFVFNIALVLQLIPVGDAIMADRYVYIPSVGFFILLGVAFLYISTKHNKYKNVFTLVLVLHGLGLAFQANARCKVWHDSVSLWTDQIKKFPNHGFSYNQRGHAKDEKNDLEGALEDYKRCIELDPFHSRAYNNIGIIETTKGNYDLALRYFDKTIALNKNNDFAYKNRARTKYLAGNHLGAIQDYTTFLRYDTTDFNVYLTRGYSYSVLNDFENALSDYNRAIKMEPSKAESYLKRGTLKSMKSDFKSALLDFDEAIELAPNNIEAIVNRAIVKSILNDFDGALLDYSKALEINPTFAEGYRNRGKTYISKGEKEKACTDFQKAIELGSDAAIDLNTYCK